MLCYRLLYEIQIQWYSQTQNFKKKKKKKKNSTSWNYVHWIWEGNKHLIKIQNIDLTRAALQESKQCRCFTGKKDLTWPNATNTRYILINICEVMKTQPIIVYFFYWSHLILFFFLLKQHLFILTQHILHLNSNKRAFLDWLSSVHL